MKRISFILFLVLAGTLPGLRAATFIVTNASPAGLGSLAQAILDANANPGADTITFNLSGSLIISPTNALPVITETVAIDGSTQPGYSNAPLIEVNGAGAGPSVSGFIIAADACVVRALAVNRFDADGIQITNGVGSLVAGCYLGIALDGVTRRGNGGAGVRLTGPDFSGNVTTVSNIVGGTTWADHNLISANGYGIYLLDSQGNTISGNYIGTDATGLLDEGNTNSGVYIYDYYSAFNTVGGTNAGAGNLISGNGENYSQYSADGVTLGYCFSNSVFGNFIGVDVTGTTALPNGQHGVNVLYSGGGHVIGGPGPGQRNLISGNQVNGVNFGSSGGEDSVARNTGPVLPEGSVVQGNFIGTDLTGMSALPNQNDGVSINYFSGNTIGGAEPGEGNVISGNQNNGVEFACCNGAISNLVAGNLIGVTATNAQPLGNLSSGVFVYSGNNVIGGTDPGTANLIAYNGGSGVQVNYNSTSVAILGNSIYANTNFGIDLQGNYGPDLNDPGDTDTGGNNVQNYPVLGFPLQYPSQVIISGTLNSDSNATYRIELFDNATHDPSAYGQGQTYLGFVTLQTDAAGNGSFLFTNPTTLPLSHYLTATATDTNNNTSEFSLARRVVQPDSVDIAVTITNSANPAPRATNFFYTITVTNNGPADATGVVVTAPIPDGLTFVSATSSQGACNFAGGVVTGNVGALDSGAGAVIVITVRATITGQVILTATALANEPENDPSNNSASVVTTLGLIDLAVLTSDSPDPVVAGQTVTYTIIATNSGPDDASGVTLYFYPDATAFVTGAGVSQGSVSTGGGVVGSLDTIPAHASATLTVSAIPTVTGTNYNYVYSYAQETDLASGNNDALEQTVVLAGPGVVQFTSSAYSINESAGIALITVQRTGGALGTVTVDYATSNLTAIAGLDYVSTAGTLTFAPGVTSNTFTVPILDDGALDCNEALALHLYQPTGGAVLVGNTNATLEIFDNHRSPGGLVQVASPADTNLVTTGNGGSFTPSMSDDGRYVVFGSYANNLVMTPPALSGGQIYLRDRITGVNTLVSLDSTGTRAADNYQSNPQLSADGQVVGFLSYSSNLTTNPPSGFTQIYARHLATGSNVLVSVNTNGAGANYYSDRFSLSGNGLKVAFRSYASDLVPGDTNQNVDIFYRDLAANSSVLVSINSAGTGSANGYSDDPVISADGRYVAFGSYASNLSPADNNTRFDIYRRDMVAGTTALVSANGSGLAGNNSCGSDLFISGDGRYVAFESYASDLVPSTPTFVQEVFVRDLLAGTTILASLNNSNLAANSYSYVRGFSQDGRYVLFESSANNLISNAIGFRSETYLRDTWSNITSFVTVNSAGTGPGNDSSYSPILSANGRYVAFLSAATDLAATPKQSGIYDVFVRDRQAGVTTLLSTTPGGVGANSSGTELAVSSSGVVAFGDYASDLVSADNNSGEDIFARGPLESAPELLSEGIGITGNGYVFEQRPTADGTGVAFASYAANLVSNDTNGSSDVFLYHLASGAMTLVSANDAGNGTRAGNSDQPRPSADGRFVAFHNYNVNIGLAAAAPLSFSTPFGQIFLRDTLSNLTTLISVNRGNTAPGNGDSINPQITPDGTFVVFESLASDLVSNDLNGAVSDVFIRNRNNNAVELVSVNSAGTGSADAESHNPVVSADGRYVAFESYASNLVSAPTLGQFNVYLRDRLTGSNILCSHNLAGNGGDASSYSPAVSADGRYVSFQSYADDLVAGDTNFNADVFVFDRVTRAVQLVSCTTAGAVGDGGSFDQSISDDGRYVAFDSTSSNLVGNDGNGPLTDVFVRDLLAGTTTLVSVNCAGNASGNDHSYASQISGNGRYVIFESYAFDLVPGDFSSYVENLFRRDLQTGTTVLLSQNRTLLGAGNNNSFDGRPSTDGGVVSFLSSASDLVFGDVNYSDDVFAWTAAGATSNVDLALFKTASAGSLGVGGPLAYTLAVTNYGLATASGVVVTDALPAGLTFVSASTSQGTVVANGNLLTCAVGTLTTATGARIIVNVTPTALGYLTNTALAHENEADPNPGNNSSTAIVLVTAPPPPALTSLVTNGNQLLLSWPSSATGFHLQSATNLTPVVAWAPVTNSNSDNGLLRFVLLNLDPAQPVKFYRLIYP